jgi:hypothetical protein
MKDSIKSTSKEVKDQTQEAPNKWVERFEALWGSYERMEKIQSDMINGITDEFRQFREKHPDEPKDAFVLGMDNRNMPASLYFHHKGVRGNFSQYGIPSMKESYQFAHDRSIQVSNAVSLGILVHLMEGYDSDPELNKRGQDVLKTLAKLRKEIKSLYEERQKITE